MKKNIVFHGLKACNYRAKDEIFRFPLFHRKAIYGIMDETSHQGLSAKKSDAPKERI